MPTDRPHHRKSTRIPGYDYSQPGVYFITIVTQRWARLFGQIVQGKMRLSEAGVVAEACWRDIAQHFPQAELGAYMVMPNHIHGIIVLHEHDDRAGASATSKFEAGITSPPARDNRAAIVSPTRNDRAAILSPPVGAQHAAPLPAGLARPHVEAGSLGAIVRSYKSAVTRQIGRSVWQRNYYEHIIRDERDHQQIHDYILANPRNWEKDEESR